MSKTFKVIISGGGTGGHIFPAISIANALKQAVPDCEILFVGAIGRMEMEKVPAAGYRIEGLPVAGLQRNLSLSNLALPFKVIKSVNQASRILKTFKPNIVVGVGGYASGPLLWSASRHHIPFVIQEQNSFAGLTNKILAKKARRFCVAYEGMEKFFPKERITLTGNPIRNNLQQATEQSREEGRKFFELDPARKTLLVIGGSLGARTLNKAVESALGNIEHSSIQIIWQCGKFYYSQELENRIAPYNKWIKLHAFISRMDLAYAVADAVISRAGAGSISELCVVKKACIFVPSPNVAEDHQTHNALALVNKEAALMITDAEAPEKLMPAAMNLCENPQQIEQLETNIGKLAQPNAAAHIAQIILEEAHYEA